MHRAPAPCDTALRQRRDSAMQVLEPSLLRSSVLSVGSAAIAALTSSAVTGLDTATLHRRDSPCCTSSRPSGDCRHRRLLADRMRRSSAPPRPAGVAASARATMSSVHPSRDTRSAPPPRSAATRSSIARSGDAVRFAAASRRRRRAPAAPAAEHHHHGAETRRTSASRTRNRLDRNRSESTAPRLASEASRMSDAVAGTSDSTLIGIIGIRYDRSRPSSVAAAPTRL